MKLLVLEYVCFGHIRWDECNEDYFRCFEIKSEILNIITKSNMASKMAAEFQEFGL